MLNCIEDIAPRTVEMIKSMSCSRTTVVRRVEELNLYVKGKFKSILNTCKHFSVALNETTDVTDNNQLLTCAWAVNDSFNVKKEILSLYTLHEASKGEDIYNAFIKCIEEHMNTSKLVSICTDGAPAMIRKKMNLKVFF